MSKYTRTKLWRMQEGKKRGIKCLPPLPHIEVKLSNGMVIRKGSKVEAVNITRRLKNNA